MQWDPILVCILDTCAARLYEQNCSYSAAEYCIVEFSTSLSRYKSLFFAIFISSFSICVFIHNLHISSIRFLSLLDDVLQYHKSRELMMNSDCMEPRE
eukprot:55928_1